MAFHLDANREVKILALSLRPGRAYIEVEIDNVRQTYKLRKGDRITVNVPFHVSYELGR
jgi:hypothetical protein